jgi:hypothetical protein
MGLLENFKPAEGFLHSARPSLYAAMMAAFRNAADQQLTRPA